MNGGLGVNLLSFALLAIGVLWLRGRGLLTAAHAPPFNLIVLNLTLPALVLDVCLNAHLRVELFKMTAMGAMTLVLGGLSSLVLMRRIGTTGRKVKGSVVLLSVFGNTTYFGYPLIFTLFGADMLVEALFFDQLILPPSFFGIGAIIAAYYGQRVDGRASLVSRLARFPPLWALVLGLAWNLVHPLDVPETVTLALRGVGRLTVPLLIIVISLQTTSLRRWRSVALAPICAVAVARMVICPTAVFVVAPLIGLTHTQRAIAVLLAAMPSAMSTTLLSNEFNLDSDLVANAILFTTLLSFPVIALWYRLVM